jgi:biotin transport system substrate-specific component
MKPTSNAEGNLVSKVLSVRFAPIAADLSLLRKAGIALAGSALVAVCAHVALPLYFTPVPLTLQTLAVLLIGLLLSPRLAAATLVAYLIEGALGLPVFAPSPLGVSGLAHLFGPTGGYLLACPLAAALASFLYRRSHRGFLAAALSAAAGSLIILALGALWLAIFTHAPMRNVLTLTVIPFLPGDALKIVAAAALATGFARLRRHKR